MKSRFKSCILAIFALLSVASCDKEQVLEPQQRDTKVISVSLSADIDDDVFRLTQVIGEEGKPIKPIIVDGYAPVLAVSVRAQGSAEPEAPQDLLFKVRAGKIYYSGELTVPANAQNLEVSAILLKLVEVDADGAPRANGKSTNMVNKQGAYYKNIHITNLARKNTDGNLGSRVPYTAEWASLNRNEEGKLVHHFTLKPSGTLIRLRINNTRSIAVSLEKMQIYTNAFWINWQYDFEAFDKGAKNLKHGQKTQDKDYNDAQYHFTRDKAPVTLQPGQTSDWFYIWAMPVKDQPERGYKTHINLIETTQTGQTYPVAYEFLSNKALDWGSVKMEFGLKDGTRNPSFAGVQTADPRDRTIPLMFVARTNLTQDRQSLAPDNRQASFGKFSQAEVDQYFSPQPGAGQVGTVEIDGYRYIMPRRTLWNGILFAPDMPITFTPEATDQRHNTTPGHKQVFDVGQNSQSDVSEYYKPANQSTIYGFRFTHINTLRTAYRYRIVEHEGERMLEVTSRFLGEAYQGDMSHIARDEFWNYRSDMNIVRYFGTTEAPIGLYLSRLTESTNDIGTGYTASDIMRTKDELDPYRSRKMAIRLFRSHPIENKEGGVFAPY